MDVFLSGFLETFICVILTLDQIDYQGLNETSSDSISNGFAYLNAFILVVLVIMIGYFTIQKVYYPDLFDEERYGFIMADIKSK